jgi:ABC-type nitrate/sulfonate/bicarbonate transport system substrate-binding protein
MKKLSFLIAILFMALLLSNCDGFGCSGERKQKTEKVKITVGYQPMIFYSYLFVAEHFNMFEEAGIEVELQRFTSANKMFQAFLAGQLDVTGLTATEVMLRGYEKDTSSFKSPIYVELNPEHIVDHVIVLQDSPIKKLEDIKGKTIGSHPGTTVPNVFVNLMKLHGIQPEEYEIRPLNPDLQIESVLSGAVDGIICLEPTGTRLLATQRCCILYSNPFSIIDVRVPASFSTISTDIIKKNKDAVDRYVHTIFKAIDKYYELFENDKALLAEILSKRLNINQEEFFMSPMVVYVIDKNWNNDDFNKTAEFYIEHDVLTKPFSLDFIKYSN